MTRRLLILTAVAIIAASCADDAPAAPTTTQPAVAATTAPTTDPAPPSTQASAEATTPTAPTDAIPTERQRLVIHVVGDVNFCDCLHSEFLRHGFDLAFSGLDGLFRRDDLTIVNLECDPSEEGSLLSNKPWSFRCNLDSLAAMKSAGVDVTGIANNHAGDYGAEGLIDGRANLEAAGLNPVGAGSDLEEANQPRIFTIGGWKIGVVAFSGVSGLAYTMAPFDETLNNPWFASPGEPGVAPATFPNMVQVVTNLDRRVDFVIVSLHQGAENTSGRPFPVEAERMRALVAAGADAVIAHHHHQLFPFEYIEGVPIFWGMGNFVWSRVDAVRNATGVAELVIETDGTMTGRLIPAVIASSGHPVLLGPPDPAVRSDRDGMG